MRTPLVAFIAFILACSATSAIGQMCITEPYELVMPSALESGDKYGTAIAASGDWLFIGAHLDDQMETDAGAVYVFHLEDGVYQFHQKLLATGGVGPAHFGYSVAAHGDVLVVGAESDREISQSSPVGAAYIFRLQDGLWTQEQKLYPFGVGIPRFLGVEVATQDDVAIVGCRHTVENDGVPGMGAAYVYRFDGTSWIDEQRLISDAPSTLDRFGTALAMKSEMIVVGSYRNSENGEDTGAVFVFQFKESSWVQTDKFFALNPVIDEGFGYRISLDEDVLAVSTMLNGKVHVLKWNGTQWQHTKTLVRPYLGFGSSLSVKGEWLLVGAPGQTLAVGSNTYLQAGGVSVFRNFSGAWVEDRSLHAVQDANFNKYPPLACWYESMPPPSAVGWPQSPAQVKLGLSVCVAPGGLLAGSELVRKKCWGYTGPANSGAVSQFAFEWSMTDCNFNGIPDECDPSPNCNGNYVPDSCEDNVGETDDCNDNSMPDECDAGIRYTLNDGFGSFAYGINPLNGNADMIWLNQYRVVEGGQYITSVALQATPLLPMGAPLTVLIYADPTRDGDPTDASLLATAQTFHASYDGPPRLILVPIATTYVGEPGDFFFLGAVVHPLYLNSSPFYWAAAIAKLGPYPYKRSWYAAAPPGAANIYDLANNASPIQSWQNSPFVLRAVASDCNGNGAWDACEIAAGEVPDVNGNGIPDTCEVPDCFFADLVPAGGDGEVDVLDLLHVVNNWGVCNPCFAICPGDTNDDCATNVIDLLAVINGWGPCK